MNLLEQQLDYPLAEVLPAEGVTVDVAPGDKRTRMVLPFALNRINLWLLREEQEDPINPGRRSRCGGGPAVSPSLDQRRRGFAAHLHQRGCL